MNDRVEIIIYFVLLQGIINGMFRGGFAPVAASVGGAYAAGPVKEVRIRDNFPETWLWDGFDIG